MTLTQLARELKVDKATVSRWRMEPWFPQQDTEGGYDVEEIRRRAAVNGKRIASAGPGTKLAAEDSSDVQTLMSGNASADEIRRATVNLVAKRLAAGIVSGSGGAKDADAVARALEELRRGEREDFDLRIKRGEYIQRDTAKAVAGALALKLTGILNTFENLLASQIEQWMADTAFQNLPTDERRRVVRGWVESQGRELREIGANEIEGMIASEDDDERV